MGILGMYTSIFLIVKMLPSSPKKEVPVVAASSTSTDGAMPSVDSAEFDKWISTEGNFEKLFA